MLTLALTRLDVTPTLSPPSSPATALLLKLLDDTHTVDAAPVLPSLHRPLRFTLPTLDTATVMLTDPVAGVFVPVTLLAARDSPP